MNLRKEVREGDATNMHAMRREARDGREETGRLQAAVVTRRERCACRGTKLGQRGGGGT